MPFLFSTALSGLRASSNALGVTGNNIANANTTAFKSGSITFSDIFLNSLGLNKANMPLQIGNGVTTASISRDFSQGNLNESGSPTNLAVQGTGYFVVQDDTGVLYYTRAGDFTLSNDGSVVTPTGQKLQGYAAVDGVIPANAPIGTIQVPIGDTIKPSVTSEATFRLNLNSTDGVDTEFTASVRVYDSLGVARSLNIVYTKTGDLTYDVTANVDGTDAPVTPTSLTFDADGKLVTPAAPTQMVVTPDQTNLNGATLPAINVNLFKTDGTPNITNFAASSGVSSASQNGFAPGAISNILTDKTGTLTAVFSNGQARSLGQVALAVFNSQDGLQSITGNLFGETIGSGPAAIGRPGTGGRGDVVGNALEQSNVDIATEFTNLIIAQRSYQANSRVITTFSQTLQDLLQII